MTVAIACMSGLSPQKRNARSWSSLNCRRSSVISDTSRVFSIALLMAAVERDLAEPFGIVRLDDVVGGAEAHRFDDGRGLLAARQHDRLQLRLAPP